MQRLDWDDLRYALAVAEQGSLAAAARVLGVNHTTVLRRVTAFEETLGVRLFDRQPSGYVPTEAGEALLDKARRMDGLAAEFERAVLGADLRIAGPLRITTTDTLAASVLPEILVAFAASHPDVQVELSTSNQFANLSKRDADLAIRPASQAPDSLVGRKVATIAFAVYGADETAGWIAPDDSLSNTTVARWLRETRADAPIVAKADSLLTMRDLAAAGLGRAALPCFLGDRSNGLRRLHKIEPTNELWLLTHEDLRTTARVATAMTFFGTALAARRSLFEGT
ncbi:LysR family transcriptional regulator [Roseiterribacter gracilis]|uniref:LysR family transcriptional regulator n=1 Tax=Roseiterribacter gracilis TaxID=2812848 RepID=A0A8S8XBC6_9PROT|nr:LysR family transcriptional regulator [Rhodospirillales bacterium TMPK1]